MPSGSAFVAETAEGPTAVVLLGRGRMRFAPSDAAERTQVRIFSGERRSSPTEFDAAFIRVRPAEFARLFPPGGAHAAGRVGRRRPARRRRLRRLHRPDLQPRSARSEPRALVADSDVRRSDRRGPNPPARQPHLRALDEGRRRHLAVRPEAAAQHRRLCVAPEAGARAAASTAKTSSSTTTCSATSSRSPSLPIGCGSKARRRSRSGSDRVRALDADAAARRTADRAQRRRRRARPAAAPARRSGRTACIVNFPTTLRRNTEISLRITYGGRLEPQQIDREGIVARPQATRSRRTSTSRSSRSTSTATAATGIRRARSPTTRPPAADHRAGRVRRRRERHRGRTAGRRRRARPARDSAPRKLFVFEADRPVRYLACVISRFTTGRDAASCRRSRRPEPVRRRRR